MMNGVLFSNQKNNERTPRRSPCRGLLSAFTLIELLVVIGILGLLSSLVLVGVAAVKSSSKTAQCKNNHRQCALTALIFLGDNHKYLSSPFADSLFRSGPNVYNGCVSINGVGFSYNGWGSGGRYIDESLGLLEVEPRPWPGGTPSMGLPESKVLLPSDMLMFLDYVDLAHPPRMRNDTALTFTNFPHHGTINVSYCDGHVDSLSRRELVAIPDNIKVKYNNDHLAHADTW